MSHYDRIVMEGDFIWPPVCHPSMAAEPQQGLVAIGKLIEPAVLWQKRLWSRDFLSPASWMENRWRSILAQEETCNIELQVKGEEEKTISLTRFSALKQCDGWIFCGRLSVTWCKLCVEAPNLMSYKAFPSKGRSIEANWSRSVMTHCSHSAIIIFHVWFGMYSVHLMVFVILHVAR